MNKVENIKVLLQIPKKKPLYFSQTYNHKSEHNN